MTNTPIIHRGIEIVQTDPGMWIWSDDMTGAGDIAHSEAEARRQVDDHLGPAAETGAAA